jgi:MFS family permease
MSIGVAVAAALAPSIGWLIAARAVQGLGAATLMVVPRAVICDVATGPEATRIMATIMIILSVSPMLAPLAGSLALAWGGWRDIFLVLAGASLLSMALIVLVLPETLPSTNHQPQRFAHIWKGTKYLLCDPRFMGVTMIGVPWAEIDALPVVIARLFLASACLGLVVPTTMVMSLDLHPDIAGLASSIGGTVQMLTGGLMSALTGPFLDNSVLPMAAAISVCACLAWATAALLLPRLRLRFRGGSVCLNSFGRFAKWISASIILPPSSASAH